MTHRSGEAGARAEVARGARAAKDGQYGCEGRPSGRAAGVPGCQGSDGQRPPPRRCFLCREAAACGDTVPCEFGPGRLEAGSHTDRESRAEKRQHPSAVSEEEGRRRAGARAGEDRPSTRAHALSSFPSSLRGRGATASGSRF